MSCELIHASVPKGLHGDSGFAVVAMTAGMDSALVSVLKDLSAYDFDPRRAIGADGIDHGHRIVSVQGIAHTVLSRIGPCGVDGSGRPNRIAHHVVVAASERPTAGPTVLAARLRFEESVPPVGQRQVGPVVPELASSHARVPAAWTQAGYDPGLAGLAARMVLDAGGAPCYLVFDRPVEALPLIDDLLALLPEERRWMVTYSTRFLRAGPGVRCQLRCVREGAPGVAALLAEPGARHILCGPSASAGESDAAAAARAGRAIPLRLGAEAGPPRVEPVLRAVGARSGLGTPVRAAERRDPIRCQDAVEEAPSSPSFDDREEAGVAPVVPEWRRTRADLGLVALVLFAVAAIALIASAILVVLLVLGL